MAEERPKFLRYNTTTDDGKSQVVGIAITPKVPSLKWRRDTRKLIAKHYEEGRALDGKYVDEEGNPRKLSGVEAVEYRNEVAEFQARIDREIFLAGIDTRQNTTEEVELLNSPIDGDFYQEVDFEEVEAFARYFRSKI